MLRLLYMIVDRDGSRLLDFRKGVNEDSRSIFLINVAFVSREFMSLPLLDEANAITDFYLFPRRIF